jgi:hypothetical protein
MKIFGIQFGSEKQLVRTEPQALSTPFGKIGKGNLSTPFIQTYIHKAGVIYFGADNLYPSIINQMYYTSPIHGACVDFTVNAVIGGGFDVTGLSDGIQKVDFLTFVSKNKLKKVFPNLVRDFKLHGRVHLLMKFSDSGIFLKMERIDPASIRYRMDGDYDFSSDWSTGKERVTIERFHPEKVGKCCEMLFTYGDLTPGQDIYPIPTYISALNWVYLDGEQSFLHKSNIQNSIFPSVYIRRPKRFGSKKEIQDFTDGLEANKGAENAGRVLVLTGDGIDQVPEVQSFATNNNDKLFEGTARELKDNICFAHKMNPAIMGIKVAGSLGNAQELQMSYNIFEKNVVLPFRDDMEDMFNEIMQIANVRGQMKINGYKIIDDVVVEEKTPAV